MPAMSDPYDSEYFESFKESSLGSARVIVPLVFKWVRPRSVIDFGCGQGDWLSVWKEAGCDVTGVDGDWVNREKLAIPPESFVTHDLTKPYDTSRLYDLAMSVEAAEHLPAEFASEFVHTLTRSAPVVLFSAAIPHQPGRNHINCQWPEYWAALFAERNFVTVDSIRYFVWDDSRVAWWYQQNIMMYAEKNQLERFAGLEEFIRGVGRPPHRLVHPSLFNTWVDWGIAESRRYWELRAATDENESDN
jgi:SAM-dependent methyltransferase